MAHENLDLEGVSLCLYEVCGKWIPKQVGRVAFSIKPRVSKIVIKDIKDINKASLAKPPP